VGMDGPAAHLYEAFGFRTVLDWIEYRKVIADNDNGRPR
jgi:hypothetical protein